MGSTASIREISDRLRDRIIGALHLGQLKGGDRLPSIREMARELGEDQRKVARAYRLLEAEGLVEVRGRSGVYSAPQARLGGGILEETAEWLTGVLLEGWKRRINIPDFPELVRKYSGGVPVRCAFLDSCEDAMEAFGYELREEFGIQVTPVWLQELRPTTPLGRSDGRELPAALREADFVVTTIFSVTAVRAVVQSLAKPVIVVTVHPRAAATVVNHLQRGSLTLVCADPSFGDRIRLQYREHIQGDHQLRMVLADDEKAVASLDPSEPVLLTRAARKRIGDAKLKLLTPHSPTLSSTSAQEIIRTLIRVNSGSG